MSSILNKLGVELRPILSEVQRDLQSESKQFSGRSKGVLSKGFRGSIRQTFGDPDALVWKTVRHAYILNSGIEPGTQSNRSRGGFVYSRGLKKTNFITDTIDRHIDDIADIVAKHSTTQLLKQGLVERVR